MKKKVDLYNKKGEFAIMLRFGKVKGSLKIKKDSGIDLNSPKDVRFMLDYLSDEIFDEWFKSKHLTYKGMKKPTKKELSLKTNI